MYTLSGMQSRSSARIVAKGVLIRGFRHFWRDWSEDPTVQPRWLLGAPQGRRRRREYHRLPPSGRSHILLRHLSYWPRRTGLQYTVRRYPEDSRTIVKYPNFLAARIATVCCAEPPNNRIFFMYGRYFKMQSRTLQISFSRNAWCIGRQMTLLAILWALGRFS